MRLLHQIVSGTSVFIDANIFVIAQSDATKLGDACRDFLARIQVKDLHGYTSTAVVSEVIHREIVTEAREKVSSQINVTYLQKNPQVVRQLTRHLAVASNLRKINVDILPVTVRDLHASKHYRATFGLMANDSLIAAVMQNANIADLATRDAGFDTVQTLRAWGLASP